MNKDKGFCRIDSSRVFSSTNLSKGLSNDCLSMSEDNTQKAEKNYQYEIVSRHTTAK